MISLALEDLEFVLRFGVALILLALIVVVFSLVEIQARLHAHKLRGGIHQVG